MPNRSEAARLHRGATVIDMVCPLLVREQYIDEWITGGATCVGATVAHDHTLVQTMDQIAMWYERFGRLGDKILHVTRVEDIARAKRDGVLGIIFHFQNTQPLERNAGLVEVYYRLGVRIDPAHLQPEELGRRRVRRAHRRGVVGIRPPGDSRDERVGMVVDLSHTGYQTTMEAMDASESTVVFSHSGAKAVHESARNLRDDQIRAVAAKGGVIGLNGFPAFVGNRRWPPVDDLIDHAAHIASLVGTDHLSVGIDYYHGQWPFASAKESAAMYAEALRSGRWRSGTYPKPTLSVSQRDRSAVQARQPHHGASAPRVR